MVLLSDNTGPEMGIMRKNIMNIYELLRVKLNFMIPLSLCKFMWKIRKIEADGTIVVDEEKDYNISSRGNAGAAYNVMGCDNLSNAKALEAVKEAVAMNDAKSYKALLNAFKAGTAPGKGQLRQLGFVTSQGPSLLDVLGGHNSIQNDTLENINKSRTSGVADPQTFFEKYGGVHTMGPT